MPFKYLGEFILDKFGFQYKLNAIQKKKYYNYQIEIMILKRKIKTSLKNNFYREIQVVEKTIILLYDSFNKMSSELFSEKTYVKISIGGMIFMDLKQLEYFTEIVRCQ